MRLTFSRQERAIAEWRLAAARERHDALSGHGREGVVRPATVADTPEILNLIATSYDGAHSSPSLDYWRWKHEENPFGPSPCLVAESNGRLVGVRVFLRWNFYSENRCIRAARAVDTATHPEWRGKGVFSRLTMRLVEQMQNEGVSFIYNTPNGKSMPGYLKMGWAPVTRIPLWIRPMQMAGLAGRALSRTPAAAPMLERFGTVAQVLNDPRLPAFLAEVTPADERYHTAHTPGYLRWRYARVPGISYCARLETAGDAGALVIARGRIRGRLREVTISELIVTPSVRGTGSPARCYPSCSTPRMPITSPRARHLALGHGGHSRASDSSQCRISGLTSRPAGSVLPGSTHPGGPAGAALSATSSSSDTMFNEWAAFVLVGVLSLMAAAWFGTTPYLRVIRNLLIAGVLMRMVGVLARYTMIFDLYGGTSDAVGYFENGRIIAEYFRALDFSIIGSGMWGDREWGTQSIRYASGLVLALVGPSVHGAFLVFSLAAFIGLVCIVLASRDGRGTMGHASLLLFFWPTLWFWPSSIGKEAVLLLAVGLVMLGYTGRGERIRWVMLATGLSLAMVIRPHLAGVLAVSICVAEWTCGKWTASRAIQAALVSALALWVVTSSLGLLGLGGADLDTMQAFVEYTGGQTNQGGSAFERTGFGMAVPMAFVNILARPFMTEANSAVALVSSLEMMVFWLLVLRHGRGLRLVLRSWQSNRLLRFAIPFTLLYVLMLGITFQNAGIIARQRTLVMPAMLAVLAMAQAPHAMRTRTRQQRRLWRRPEREHLLASA